MLLAVTVIPASAQAFASVQLQSKPSESVADPNQVSLKVLLDELESNFAVRFNYRAAVVRSARVSARPLAYFNGGMIDQLNRLLSPLGLLCVEIDARTFVIREKRSQRRQPSAVEGATRVDSAGVERLVVPPAAELKIPHLGPVPDRFVTGRVTDAVSGEGLPGVSIRLKGTQRGMNTDAEGKFSINVPDEHAVLSFSFVGYVSQEIVVGEGSVLKILLEVDQKSLEEVVVVGYGTQRKANLTGAVSSVDFENEALSSRAVTNVSTMLAGMSSGIRVQQQNGLPGDNNNSSLNVRGVGSLNSSSAPLVVIDGQVADINSVSPNDVASVTILKDAASAAIYGSRASNGVILITTKAGKDTQGKVTFNYNNFIGWKTPAQVANLVHSSPDYMELVNMMMRNSGMADRYSQEYIEEWREGSRTDPIYYPNTNWLTAMIKRNKVTNHNFSARGGNERIGFYTSVDYFKDDGLVPNTGFRRVNFRNNLTYNVNKWLKFGNNLTLISTKADPGSVSDGFQWMRATTPAVVPKHPDGRYGSGQLSDGEGGANNTLMNLEVQRGENKGTQLQGKVFAVITPLEGLSVTGSYFSDFKLTDIWEGQIYADQWNFQTNKIGINRTNGSRFQLTNRLPRNHRQIYDLYADYTKALGDHSIQALVGFNQEYYLTKGLVASRNDLLSYDTPVLDAAAADPQATGGANDFSLRSFFGRLAYQYKGKYLLETNMRYDGSSRFAPDKRWGLFPSFSAGWVVSAEDFWEPLSGTVNDLKLRVSWGKLGNNGIGNYEWQEFYQANNYNFGGNVVQGLSYNVFGNSAITWESTNVLNIGADIRLFNTLNLDLNYYDKFTNNILANLPIPLVNGGIGAPRVNAAEVRNRGLEAELKYLVNVGKVALSFAANIGYNKNRIVKYKGGVIEARGTSQAWAEGQPIGVYWLREVDQIIQDKSVVEALVSQGVTFNPSVPGVGDFLYKNTNGDNAINDNDRVLKGNPIPLYTYGGKAGAAFAGFDFNIFFDGVGKWDRYLQGSLYSLNHQVGYQWPQEYLNAWTESSPSTTIPKIYFSNPKNDQVSDYFLRSAAYLKIRSIQLGYELPSNLTRLARIGKLRVFTNMENYFTFTGWPTMDPEVTTEDGSDQTYPLSKTFSVGVSLSF
ncbi:TonB-dependent receptor [Ravibacter arvi]|uniref:TonB-dependent receptor n=2 Tax=Ravibacter arvi TaxID=2051041 RepID=A0ABP8M8S4_9BACT